nr:prenyltransferase [Caldanaerobacter subterraneus]
MTILAACAIGLAIVIFREPLVLIVGLLGILMAVFYSLPPFKFSYRGLGEIAVRVTFGPFNSYENVFGDDSSHKYGCFTDFLADRFFNNQCPLDKSIS